MTTPNEAKVLALLASGSEDFGVMSFAEIAHWIRLTRKEIRRACRSLKRKGFAEFYRGCWTEDGVPAGSGYGATAVGREKADAKLVEKFVNKRWD
jgi:DNA-binding MurR/RpiR family transcriptional regulator